MKLYLDTNVFIYAIESSPPESAAREIISLIARTFCPGVTSELTRAELFAPRQGKGRLNPFLRAAYEKGFATDFEMAPVSRHSRQDDRG